MRTWKPKTPIRAPLDDMKISGIHCELGTYVGKLLRYAEEKKAINVVKAWGKPLFAGATFTVYHLGASVTTHTYAEIAAMFDLPLKAALKRAEPRPAVVRKRVRVTRPPTAKAPVVSIAPSAPAPARAPLVFIPADEILGRRAA